MPLWLANKRRGESLTVLFVVPKYVSIESPKRQIVHDVDQVLPQIPIGSNTCFEPRERWGWDETMASPILENFPTPS